MTYVTLTSDLVSDLEPTLSIIAVTMEKREESSQLLSW